MHATQKLYADRIVLGQAHHLCILVNVQCKAVSCSNLVSSRVDKHGIVHKVGVNVNAYTK